MKFSELNFYKGKKVFVTGHTGFKGSWLTKILDVAGADILGYSLKPDENNVLFTLLNLSDGVKNTFGDIRDLDKLQETISNFEPEIVFHLAAQPLVNISYDNPVLTFETNVMGTVHILECIKNCESVKSFVNVTTDKVYKNNEWEWGYRENDTLGGFDPYSNSKSCSELVTESYVNSFFKNKKVIGISTARAGNVIGGGDFAKDRIVPDCIRAAMENRSIFVRNPNSIRPYQHVLEPLFAYLVIARQQFIDPVKYGGCYNIGPVDSDCITTGQLVEKFCRIWGDLKWETGNFVGKHEATYLKLDCSKMKKVFDWKPKWNTSIAIEKTVEWVKYYMNKLDINDCMLNQITDYMGD